MTTTITALTAGSTITGPEVFPGDQGGTTKKFTATQLQAFCGAPLEVTDGSTTVTNVTEINITSGATVSSGGAGIADLAIAGGGGGGGGTPATGAALKLASNLSVTSGAETPIAWSTTPVFDTGGYFNSSHPTRLTVPTTGLYEVTAALFWLYAGAPGTVYAIFEVNGVTTARIAMSYLNVVSSLNNASNNLSALLSLTAGDYVEVVALQNIGTASIAGSAGESLSMFSIAPVLGSGAKVSGASTVSALPGSPAQGDRAFVTDATATTFLSTVAGGGSDKVPVVYDGTNWVIG